VRCAAQRAVCTVGSAEAVCSLTGGWRTHAGRIHCRIMKGEVDQAEMELEFLSAVQDVSGRPRAPPPLPHGRHGG
jgi:hypothetical protein